MRNDYDEQEEEFSPRAYNRSCNQKIQNDSLNARSTFEVKRTKSMKDFQDADERDQLDEWKEEMRKKEQQKKQAKRQKETENKRTVPKGIVIQKGRQPYFGTQIVLSESVSIDQELQPRFQEVQHQVNSKKHTPNSHKGTENKNKNPSSNPKSIKLNVLLVGRSGIGKSSFIDSFCNKKYEQKNVIKERTQAIQAHKYTQSNENHQIEITFVDVPGFQELNLEAYAKMIAMMINEGFKKHLQSQKQKKNWSQKTNGDDERFHCCLFFISGPWVSQSEWFLMKKLQQMVNIVPVIAKGDTYTTAELKHFKKKIHQKNKTERVVWFDFEQILRQKHPSKVDRLTQGSFGIAPPFVIFCGTQISYDQQSKHYYQAREYRWGRCELDNDEHNDFNFLKRLITEYVSEPLLNRTDLFEKRYMQNKGDEVNDAFVSSTSSLEVGNIRINRTHRSEQSTSGIIEKESGSLFTAPVQFLLFLAGGLVIFTVYKNKWTKS